MKINGKKLVFDFYDSDQKNRRDAYISELNKINEISHAPVPEGVNPVDIECDAIKNMFDQVFGEGTGDAVCGCGHNHLVCLESFNALIESVDDQHKRYRTIKEKLSMGNRRMK